MIWSELQKYRVHKSPQRFPYDGQDMYNFHGDYSLLKAVVCLLKYPRKYISTSLKEDGTIARRGCSRTNILKVGGKICQRLAQPKGKVSIVSLCPSHGGTCSPTEKVSIDPELSHTLSMAAPLPSAVSSVLDIQTLTWNSQAQPKPGPYYWNPKTSF